MQAERADPWGEGMAEFGPTVRVDSTLANGTRKVSQGRLTAIAFIGACHVMPDNVSMLVPVRDSLNRTCLGRPSVELQRG